MHTSQMLSAVLRQIEAPSHTALNTQMARLKISQV